MSGNFSDTSSFFQQVRDHLSLCGIVVANAGMPNLGGKSDIIKAVAGKTWQAGNLREWSGSGKPFTDDWSPVEQLIDRMIIDYVIGEGK